MTGSPTGPQTSAAPATSRPRQRRRRFRRSLAGRVTLLTTIAVGLSVAFVASGAYITARVQLQDQLDESLLDRARSTARADVLGRKLDVPPWAVGASDVRIAFLRGDGLLSGARLPFGEPELQVANRARRQSTRTVMIGDSEYRLVAVPTQTPGYALLIGQSLEQQQELLSRLGAVSLVFGTLGVLGAGIAGWGVARSGLRPVRRLTGSVERIAETQELTTMPVEGDDEIARLATAFNQMLTAVDASRARQRQLVTDAGHELRTPLTSLRTNVDLLIQSDQAHMEIDPAARAELLGDIRGQIEELTTLIGDLTELARDEPLAPVVGEVDLAEVVDAAVSRVRRRAVDATFDVDLGRWEMVGEEPALERAVINMLDNAAKWGPTGGTVTVRLAEGVLTVDDQGPGIAEQDREHVFDRFWRAEESRTMPGSGLGLSIVRQVAERHFGSASAEEAPGGGARLVLRLPGRAGG